MAGHHERQQKENGKMFGIIDTLKTAARKRADYRRTVAELSRLSPAAAADLGLDREEVRRVAQRAVYGI